MFRECVFKKKSLCKELCNLWFLALWDHTAWEERNTHPKLCPHPWRHCLGRVHSQLQSQVCSAPRRAILGRKWSCSNCAEHVGSTAVLVKLNANCLPAYWPVAFSKAFMFIYLFVYLFGRFITFPGCAIWPLGQDKSLLKLQRHP